MVYYFLPVAQLVRRYVLCYIPPGFWPRLIARLITFPKRVLPTKSEVCIGIGMGGTKRTTSALETQLVTHTEL